MLRKRLNFDGWQGSVIGILLGGLIFRSILAFWLFLGYDEGYYYLYTRHLDWSYFDHPVLVALTTGFGVWITGVTSPFTLRLGTLILYTGSLWLLYLTSAKLFNRQTAILTLAIASIVPIFNLGFGVITLPDSPLIFCWTASLYCAVIEFFPHSQNNYRPTHRLAILGVLVGLACLSKYHGFVLGLGLIGFCLTSPSHRQVFLSPWLRLGFILFILTLFPLWFWNFNHDWVSLKFQLFNRFATFSEKEIASSGFDFLGVLIVFLTGIGLLFPTIGIPLWWTTFQSTIYQISLTLQGKFSRLNVHDFASKQLLILWVSLPLMLGFTLLGAKQQILVTWPMPGFWNATLLLGTYAYQWQQKGLHLIKRWLKGTALITSTILLLLLFHITTGGFYKSSQYAIFGGFLFPKQDSFQELIDIQQLQKGFAQSQVLMNALETSTFIFSNAYYLGGLIDLAIRPLKPLPVTCFSYDTRGFSFWYDTEKWIGKDGLYITLEQFHKMPHLYQDFSRYFAEFQEIGQIPIKRGGVLVNVFYVYQAKTLLKPYSAEESLFYYRDFNLH